MCTGQKERWNLFQLVVIFWLSHRWPMHVSCCCCWALTMSSGAGVGGSLSKQINNSIINNINNSNSRQKNLTFPNAIAVTNKDIQTFIRQTGQVAPSRAALGKPVCNQCQHGFAQVFALDPLPSNNRMNSGLLKLTCPLLVRAVDALEDQNDMISEFNQQLVQNKNWQRQVHQTHKVHAKARRTMLTKAGLQLLEQKMGQTGSRAFLQSGVAGASPGSKDIKCLHAWLADYLFRCTDNDNTNKELVPIGATIVKKLGGTNVLKGNAKCHILCDPSSPLAVQPPKARNKQRLKSKRESERRKRRQNENNYS